MIRSKITISKSNYLSMQLDLKNKQIKESVLIMKFELDLSSKSVVLYNEELDSDDEIKLVESLTKLINDTNQTTQVKMLVLDNIQQQLQRLSKQRSLELDNYLNNIYLVEVVLFVIY